MNYKKVIEDFCSGVIDKSKWQVCFDNDGGYWFYIGPSLSEDEEERLSEEMERRYGEPDGYNDIVNLANAAGINASWV